MCMLEEAETQCYLLVGIVNIDIWATVIYIYFSLVCYSCSFMTSKTNSRVVLGILYALFQIDLNDLRWLKLATFRVFGSILNRIV